MENDKATPDRGDGKGQGMNNLALPATLVAIVAMFAFAQSAIAEAEISEVGFNCNNGGCRSNARDAAKYQFSYALINNSSYIVKRVILKARVIGWSKCLEVRTHHSNTNTQNGVTFSFNEEWIADTFDVGVAELKKNGFEVRGNIRSTYEDNMSRKETNCPIVEVRYDAEKDEWRYNRKDQNTTFEAEPGNVFMWKAAGTAGHVDCKVATRS